MWTVRKYDLAGFLTEVTDPKGQTFRFENLANGRRSTLSLVSGEQPRQLGAFTWDGNRPTSDGATSWTLDEAGRVTACNGVSYKYQHPLGLLTEKSYGGVTLNYGYDQAGLLQSLSDGTNTLTYTSRTQAGWPLAANYSN